MQREGFGRAALILALVIAVGLGVLLVRHQRQERRRDASLQAMQKQAEPLERELARLQRDLEQAERDAAQQERMPFYAIGYRLSQSSDVTYAMHQAEINGFSPVFVLDLASEEFDTLMKSAGEAGAEIVLTAEPFDADALTSRPDLSDATAADSGAFLLLKEDDTPEHIAQISDAGYNCVIEYVDSAENAVLENGLVSISYSRIRNAGVSVRSRLQKASQNAQTLLFVFDLEAMHNGELPDSDISAALELILSGRKDGTARYGTVTEAIEAVRTAAESHAASRAEWEAYAAGQQQRIDEIRAELDAIYANWNGGKSK